MFFCDVSFVESDNTPLIQIQDKIMAGETMMELVQGHAGMRKAMSATQTILCNKYQGSILRKWFSQAQLQMHPHIYRTTNSHVKYEV